MGFSCPVCGDPQADGVHLANHLAITALTRGGDHERWLDEQVPEWEQLGEEKLAEKLRELADETEYPQVFEDTTDQHDHDGGHDHHSDDQSLPPGADMLTGDLDEETAGVIREAMEMTRERTAASDGEASQKSDVDEEASDDNTKDEA